jgi:hypothetical protein
MYSRWSLGSNQLQRCLSPLEAQQKAFGNMLMKRLRFEAETKRAHLVIDV